MMHDDEKNQNFNDSSDYYTTTINHSTKLMSSSSVSPPRRQRQQQQEEHERIVEAPTTAQMHSLDYPIIMEDEYNHYQYSKNSNRTVRTANATNQDTSKHEATTSMSDHVKKEKKNQKSWFSSSFGGWMTNATTTTIASNQTTASDIEQQQRITAALDTKDISSSMETPLTTDNNDDNQNTNNINNNNIVPSSPKRQSRNLFISPLHQQQNIVAEMNHNRTEMMYSTLPGGDHENDSKEQNPTNRQNDNENDCSFFFRPLDSDNTISTTTRMNRGTGISGWKSIRRDQYKPQRSFGSTTIPASLSSLYSNNNNDSNIHSNIMYEYSDAVTVTPIPILQQYRTKFAQYNNELQIREQDGNRHHPKQYHNNYSYYNHFNNNNNTISNHHDLLELQRDPFDDWHMQQSSLQLQEYDSSRNVTAGNAALASSSSYYFNADNTIQSTSLSSILQHQQQTYHHNHQNGGIIRSDTARQSSLFYRADGRLLMRLPRDRVRLLVDPDYEAGVLSVEQWRSSHTDDGNDDRRAGNNDDDYTNNQLVMERDRDNTIRTDDKTPLPELRYVLTVSDDLYRKIVEEMSPSAATKNYFCCCSRGCCNEEEKVDISIAYVLFILIFIILFINMLAFREH